MKTKLLSALIFFSILISGCSGTDFFSTTDNQTSQTSAEKKAISTAGDGETKPSDVKSDDKSALSTEKDSESSDPDKKSDDGSSAKKSESSNKPSESTEPDDKEDSAKEKTPSSNDPKGNPDDTPVAKEPESTGATSAEEPKISTEPESVSLFKSLFGDINPIMLGIIAVLVVVTLILIWLIYDRHKMKNALNNLNNQPPKPNTVPQDTNNSPQTSATIVLQSPVNKQLTVRVDTLHQIGARKEQQDSLCISEDRNDIDEKGFMAVVADGMGGLEGGAIISNLVTDTFINSYKSQFHFEPTSFLYNAAESAEFAVEDYMKRTGITGGSTLVAVIIKNSQMDYVSIGDSHIYLFRDNTLTLINKEHSFGALLKEKADRGEIDPREPYVNPKRNSLTAYIGMGSFKIVDRNAHPIILRDGDKVILCSDGVYNALGDDALIAALAGDASTAARRIQSDVLAQNIPSQDNFTAVILECVSV